MTMHRRRLLFERLETRRPLAADAAACDFSEDADSPVAEVVRDEAPLSEDAAEDCSHKIGDSWQNTARASRVSVLEGQIQEEDEEEEEQDEENESDEDESDDESDDDEDEQDDSEEDSDDDSDQDEDDEDDEDEEDNSDEDEDEDEEEDEDEDDSDEEDESDDEDEDDETDSDEEEEEDSNDELDDEDESEDEESDDDSDDTEMDDEDEPDDEESDEEEDETDDDDDDDDESDVPPLAASITGANSPASQITAMAADAVLASVRQSPVARNGAFDDVLVRASVAADGNHESRLQALLLEAVFAADAPTDDGPASNAATSGDEDESKQDATPDFVDQSPDGGLSVTL